MSYSDRYYERLMAHPVPKTSRRRVRQALRLTPPRCDDCRRQLHPDIDHSDCEVAR